MGRPARRESVVAWELRGAWASRREVVVLCDGDRQRVRGYVEHVAASDAFALLWDGQGEAHVPLGRVRAVRRPHFSEPLDGERVAAPPVRLVMQMAGQLSFFLDENP